MDQSQNRHQPKIVLPLAKATINAVDNILQDIKYEVAVYDGLPKLSNPTFIHLFDLASPLEGPTYNVRPSLSGPNQFIISLACPVFSDDKLLMTISVPETIKQYLMSRHQCQIQNNTCYLYIGQMTQRIRNSNVSRFEQAILKKGYYIQAYINSVVYRMGRENRGLKPFGVLEGFLKNTHEEVTSILVEKVKNNIAHETAQLLNLSLPHIPEKQVEDDEISVLYDSRTDQYLPDTTKTKHKISTPNPTKPLLEAPEPTRQQATSSSDPSSDQLPPRSKKEKPVQPPPGLSQVRYGDTENTMLYSTAVENQGGLLGPINTPHLPDKTRGRIKLSDSFKSGIHLNRTHLLEQINLVEQHQLQSQSLLQQQQETLDGLVQQLEELDLADSAGAAVVEGDEHSPGYLEPNHTQAEAPGSLHTPKSRSAIRDEVIARTMERKKKDGLENHYEDVEKTGVKAVDKSDHSEEWGW